MLYAAVEKEGDIAISINVGGNRRHVEQLTFGEVRQSVVDEQERTDTPDCHRCRRHFTTMHKQSTGAAEKRI
jgi:hypothetical protein